MPLFLEYSDCSHHRPVVVGEVLSCNMQFCGPSPVNAVLEAEGEKLTLTKGMSAFIPAGTGIYTLTGKADLLRTRI